MEDDSIEMGDDSIDMGYLVTLPAGPAAQARVESGGESGRGLHSSTSQLNLSRF